MRSESLYVSETYLDIEGVEDGLFHGSDVSVKDREMKILQSSDSLNELSWSSS